MTEKSDNADIVKSSDTDRGFSASDYNTVATSAVLDAIRLISVNFKNEADFINRHSECELRYGRKITAASCFDDDERQVSGLISFYVNGKIGRRVLMKCTAEFFVMYTADEASTDEALLGYFRNIAPFAAYPYFRSLVSQMSWGANVALEPLPAIASTAHIPKAQKS